MDLPRLVSPLHKCLLKFSAVIIVAVVGLAPAVSKADVYGNNGGTSLDQAASWIDETTNTNPALNPPGALDIAQWDGNSGGGTFVLDVPTTWAGIVLTNPGSLVTIGDGGGDSVNTLTLGASGIDLSSATQSLTIVDPLALSASQTWKVASGFTVNVNSTTNLAPVSGSTLNIIGSGNIAFNGAAGTSIISGAGGSIVMNGTGTLTLGALNTYSGTTTVNSGTLVLRMSTVVPTATGASGGASPPPGTINIIPTGGTLIVGGGTVQSVGGARSDGSGTPAWVETISTLSVKAGGSTFTQSRGSSARVIDTVSNFTRTVGGTVNFMDNITASTGAGSPNSGGYRAPTTQAINSVIPFITYTTTTASSSPGNGATGLPLIPGNPLAVSWFAPAGTSTNASSLGTFTSSTDTSLGTATQNVDVVNGATTSNANITGLGATTVNTIRFNSGNSHMITMGATDSLTVGTGGILVTGSYANHKATITGGTLEGGNPGSGSGNDLIIFDYADPNAGSNALFQIDSTIIDNTTNGNPAGAATALTKSGIGTLVLTSANSSYTGNTYLNSGAIRISAEGSTTGSLGAVPVSPVANNLTFGGGTLQLGAALNLSSNRGISLANKGGTLDTNGFASTYSGLIAGTGPFTKAGLGTLRLTSANTYAGNTTVSGGTLSAVNTTGSATGSGNITVNAGAALGGSGTVTGAVNLSIGTNGGGSGSNGGHVAPGDNGVGTLNVGSISLNSGSVADMEFGSTTSNDQLNVLNSGGLTLNGGGINIYTAGTTSPFSPNGDHTFDLFHYTGTLNGDPTSLQVINPVSGFGYTFGTSGGFVTLEIVGSGGVVVSTWNADASGLSWNTSGNWTAGVPHSASDSALFGSIITADRTVNVDSAQTLGTLTFNSAHSYTLAPGAAGSITMDNTGGTGNPAIAVTGSHFITAPLTLNADTTITTNNLTDSLTLSDVHGNGGLITAGFGTVVLVGSTSDYSGNTTIGSGTVLQLGNATNPTTGSLSSSSVHDNGTLKISRSNALTINNSIDGTGNLIQAGSGVTTLNGGNSYQGGTSITGGTIVMGNSSALGSGSVSISAGAILDANGSGPSLAGVSGAGTIDNTNVNPTQITFNNSAGTTTFTGVIQNTGGQVSIDKQNSGTQVLNGANTYTGNTTIDGGILSVNSDASLGIGNAVIINNGALEINTGFSTARAITLNSSSSTIQVDTNQTLTYTNVAGMNGSGLTKAGAGILQVNGPLNLSGNALTLNGGTLALESPTGNSFSITSPMVNGTLQIDATASYTLVSTNNSTPPGSITLGNASTDGNIHVNGGTFSVASAEDPNNPPNLIYLPITLTGRGNTGNGVGSTITIETGSTTTFGDISTTNADGALITINGGTNTIGNVNIQRSAFNSNTVPKYTRGLIVNGGTTTMTGLTIGSGNSAATFSIAGGSLAVNGTISIAPGTAASRASFGQITGGTLTSTGVMLMAPAANQGANFSVAGGTTSLPGISMFQGSAAGATATVTVGGTNGGALYIDSAGIQADFSSGTSTGSVVLAAGGSSGGVLGATADWSSNVPFTLTDTTGLTSIKTADAVNAPHNITLNGAIGGAGNLVATGSGTLTLTTSNSTYSGGTVIKSGTLATTAAAVPATTLAATTTNASATVLLTDVTGLVLNQKVSGTGIPAGATITAIDTGANTVTLSSAATQDGSNPLTFSSHSALGNGPLVMAGGTLSTGGFNQILTTLRTRAASTIDLSSGNTGETLSFADSSLTHWTPGTTATGATLHIANWNGSLSGGEADQIVFPGTSLAAPPLSPNQLSQITFDGLSGGNIYAKLVSVAGGTELVPSSAPVTAGVMTLGDINQDGSVNVKDISALMSALANLNGYVNGTATYSGTGTLIRSTGGTWTASQLMNVADTNLDDVVDNRDIQGLINAIANGGVFGGGSGGGSVTAVPEPTSFLLLAIGGIALLAGGVRRTRRAHQ